MSSSNRAAASAALAVLLSFFLPARGAGEPPQVAETERLLLSGSGFGDTKEWEFRIDRGRRAGKWTRISVPSQWELEGFGEYAYGLDDEPRAETGIYRTRFSLPERWRDWRIDLVFEGVMTDTEVRIDGAVVGPKHQGGFTRFRYHVTDRVQPGREHLLEVEVSEASADRTVNAAEREADYWVFGGIYRPVYLEARPPRSIRHVAIRAEHDGELEIEVAVDDIYGPNSEHEVLALEARVRSADGEVVARLTEPIESLGSWLPPHARGGGTAWVLLQTRVSGALPWSAERPRLYTLEVDLMDRGQTVHRVKRRFGFRTIELLPERGLFVNGRRTLLKGINRHSFWPESGRTLNGALNRRDAELIKELNANAVRTSHYPPDVEFLEACDELGLYVIDELPGWHDAYGTEVGQALIAEMVRRDVNHPSILMWANGNEGGWNERLDGEFERHDPQRRPVIHPDELFAGVDTEHYLTWDELTDAVHGTGWQNWFRSLFGPLPLILPTELLHGLYDGGLGAGLADYWSLLSSSPRGVGAFLWAFVDEGVVRTDRDGAIDTFGSYAPDGLVDPYRRKEASFDAVRELWSPLVFELVEIEPQSAVLEISNRSVQLDLSEFVFRLEEIGLPGPFESEEVEIVSQTEAPGSPGAPGTLTRLDLTLSGDPRVNALRLTAVDTGAREVLTEVFVQPSWRATDALPAGHGTRVERSVAPFTVRGETARVEWQRFSSGWWRLDVEAADPSKSSGFELVFPEESYEQIEWLGGGPFPVWGNRQAGPTLGLWRRETDGEERPAGDWRGFYAGVRWMKLRGRERTLTVVPTDPGLFVGVSAPSFPEDAQNARAEVPAPGTLSFSRAVPAIGTKFHPASDLGPGPALSETPAPWTVWFRVEPASDQPTQ